MVAYLAEQPKAINILLDLGFDPEIGAIGDSEFNYSFLKTNAKKDYFC